TENACLLSFPAEAELWERSHLDLESLRNRKVITVDNCIYQKIDSGVFQRIQQDPKGACQTVGEYLQEPMVEVNYNVQEFVDQNVDIVETISNKMEVVDTANMV
ncbi:unnamed protein product, partial [Allacma fusca]